MKTQSDDTQFDLPNNAKTKRTWSTPIVIESQVSGTELPNPTQPSPRDVTTGGAVVGPS